MNRPHIDVEDKQLVYPMVIFLVAYAFFWLGLFISYWLFMAMLVFIVISSLLSYHDYVRTLKIATAIPRMIISFYSDSKPSDIFEDIDPESYAFWEDERVYGVVIKPKLLRISQPALEEALENRVVTEKFQELKDKIEAFYNPSFKLDYLASHRDALIGKFINIKDTVINYGDYDLNYFLEKKLDNFCEKKVIDFLAMEGITESNLQAQTRDKLQEVSNKIATELKKNVNLVQIQKYMSYHFKSFFLKPAELKFFRDKSINTFEDLLETDIIKLERDFNKRFSKLAIGSEKNPSWKPLSKWITEAKDEIKEFFSTFVFSLEEKGITDFYRIQQTVLQVLYDNYYLYEVEFDREFEIPIQDAKKSYYSDKMVIVLPDVWENSIQYRPRRIIFHGFPMTVPMTERIELMYKLMYRHDTPLFYCSSCSLTRSQIRDALLVDNDEILIGVIAGLSTELNNFKMEVTKLLKQFDFDQDKIEALTKMLSINATNSLADEDVTDQFQKLKRKIDWQVAPPRHEAKLYWFFTVLALIAGFFIGYAISQYFIYASLSNMKTSDIYGSISLLTGLIGWLK